MTGPAGTFTGVVTSGDAEAMGSGINADGVSYSGQWSDGVHGFGTARISLNEPLNFGLVHLDSNVVPEPSSFVLFASGLLMIAGAMRRKRGDAAI
jgi:hypothetical protein